MKQYIGISRDHSGSMSTLTQAAVSDYNQLIVDLRESAIGENIDTIVSVVKCGHGYKGEVHKEVVNSSISAIGPMKSYEAKANSTPLFDSVGTLIEMLEDVPDKDNPEVSFLVMAVTDGHENSSVLWRHKLAKKIAELQATDRWTFVFRVPETYKQNLIRLGIPEGNILGWAQTTQGMHKSTMITTNAIKDFYTQRRTTGLTATKSFFTTDLTEVSIKDVAAQMVDISSQVSFWQVSPTENGSQIRDFCESRSGDKMLKGAAFYQLTKKENEVQDYKLIGIRDKNTGEVYVGPGARQLLQLPTLGTIALAPGSHGNYEVYIQSTSVNRKLKTGTNVMYWPLVGSGYKEGKSSTRGV